MNARVATTQWSQVLAARDGSDTVAREALENLCQTYWQPLYSYIRHWGADREEARDLTQAYFAELLEKDFLASVDPSKGRFRSFLLASLRNFLLHAKERAGAQKRGGGTVTISLDADRGEASYARRPADSSTPEDVFEQRWAMTALDRALERLREETIASGDERIFATLQQYLTSQGGHEPYREAASELGMSAAGVATAVHRLRKKYGQCLRAEVADTVVDSADIDDELRHLLTIVKA